jgi:phage-related protein
MKGIEFLGSSLEAIRNFPMPARQYAGYQLDRVQHGFDPTDWKPMKSIGRGVREIRIRHDGQYRVIYLATLHDKVYVLHAFAKKTQKTNRRDLETATRAWAQIMQRHGHEQK